MALASDKIALITGANKGIGKERARGLGQKGYAVIIGSRDPKWEFDAVNVLGYCTSKSALNSVTIHFAKELRGTPIKINSAGPGHRDTDLSGHAGPRTPAQGAIAPIRLATLPADGPSGQFFDEAGAVAW